MSTTSEMLEQSIATFPKEIQELARETRKMIHSILLGVVQVVWVQQKITGFGTGPKKKTEHFCWLMLASKHVNLGFNYGAELPDPSKLLEGTGKLYRHVKIKSSLQVMSQELRALVKFATAYRVPPLKQ